MTEALTLLGRHIEDKRPDCVSGWHIDRDELTVDVVVPSIPGFVEFIKADTTCRFTTLIDITAVDHPEREKRFDIVYHFLSMHQNQRLRVKAPVREGGIVPSIVETYPAANWFEREVFDMFGILFSGHPDLRRILTDYGFRGYPAAEMSAFRRPI
ncbi:MAG: NADH-quinone oxidoreductase subunit C, partial [Pseudomonadota bacterium]